MTKFIHAADLHLDTPFSGLEETSVELARKLRKATFSSFERIVNLSIKNEVDFVLLAGDLYNTQRTNISAQSLFIKQLKRLEKEKIPVFLIHGNHDYVTEETENLSLPLPNNVYTFSEEVQTHIIQTKKNKKIAISGFSYNSQWIFERKINEYPTRHHDVDLHIGLLHGQIETNKNKIGNYAPFTVNELKQKGYDYWALGHIHKRQKIASYPLSYYPGNIQGLHKNETGEKGCLLIEWQQGQGKAEFVPTASIQWEKLTFSLDTIETIPQLLEGLRNKITEENYKNNILLHLELIQTADISEDLLNIIKRKEFKNQLTQQLGFDFLWIASISIVYSVKHPEKLLEKRYKNEWEQTIEEVATIDGFQIVTEEIFNHIPHRYLKEENTKDYRQQMIKKAIDKINWTE